MLKVADTVLQAASGNSRDGACFKLDKQTWRRIKQWYTEDDFSKFTHQNFVIFGRIFTFILFYIMSDLEWKLNRPILWHIW